MKLPAWTRIFPLAVWLAFIAALVIAAALAWYLVIVRPAALRDEALASRADATFGAGRAKAGQDAIAIIIGNQEKADAIQARIEESQNAVRQADPARRDDAAMRELCKSPSASLWPECAVFRTAQGHKAP